MKHEILASWRLPKEPDTVPMAVVLLHLPDDSATPYSVHRQNVETGELFWGHYRVSLEAAKIKYIEVLTDLGIFNPKQLEQYKELSQKVEMIKLSKVPGLHGAPPPKPKAENIGQQWGYSHTE